VIITEKNDMTIVKSPFRISLFGGSTDYKSFYEQYGSFIIGTPIDKYCYISTRFRPKILSKQYLCTYSRYELVDTIDELKNPLIRETLKYFNVNKPIELFSYSDIPSRTGLGGSSSYCIAMAYTIKMMNNEKINKIDLINSAIKIEREILNESGGIQDQIWPFAKGFSTIEITKDGKYFTKPLPITEQFEQELQNSMVLIYTDEQRTSDLIAKSHESDVNNKLNILEVAKESYKLFLKEDLKNIGKLLYQSWLNKEKISPQISNNKIKEIIDDVMYMGAYGAKLLGSGGCGFVLTICNEKTKKLIVKKYKESILDFNIDKTGVTSIY
jgi:D-glycero-alpha-D-manno-heptose-7-phosphate kinase